MATQEEIDAAKAQDARFATIELGLEIDSELRRGRGLHTLMAVLRSDADAAMAEFATINPADTAAVIGLQARVRRFTFAYETFAEIVARGERAEHSLRSEHEADLYAATE